VIAARAAYGQHQRRSSSARAIVPWNNKKETEMRKIVFALAILAGVAAPMVSANAQRFCTTQCMGNMCTTICN
jgi:hypothetical protein